MSNFIRPVANIDDDIKKILFDNFILKINTPESIERINSLIEKDIELIKILFFIFVNEKDKSFELLLDCEKKKNLILNTETISFFRLKATILILKNQFDDAEELLMKILNVAENFPKWYYRDILVDLDNITIAKYNSEYKSEIIFEKYKKELESLSDFKINPLFNDKVNKLTDDIFKEVFDIASKDKFTEIVGKSYYKKINNLIDSILSSLNYGSFTYYKIFYEKISKYIYSLYYLFNIDFFFVKSFDMFFEDRDEKNIVMLLKSKLDELMEILDIDHIKKLLEITLKNNSAKDKNIYAILIIYFSEYFDDTLLEEIYTNLIKFINEEYDLNIYNGNKLLNTKLNCLTAIKKIINRFRNIDNKIIEIINIYSEKSYLKEEIIKVLNNIYDWKLLSIELCKKTFYIIYDDFKLSIVSNLLCYSFFNTLFENQKDLQFEIDDCLYEFFDIQSNFLIHYYYVNKHNIDVDDFNLIINYLLSLLKEEADDTQGISFGYISVQELLSSFIVTYKEYTNNQIIDEVYNLYKSILTNENQYSIRKHKCLKSLIIMQENGIDIFKNIDSKMINESIIKSKNTGDPFSNYFTDSKNLYFYYLLFKSYNNCDIKNDEICKILSNLNEEHNDETISLKLKTLVNIINFKKESFICSNFSNFLFSSNSDLIRWTLYYLSEIKEIPGEIQNIFISQLYELITHKSSKIRYLIVKYVIDQIYKIENENNKKILQKILEKGSFDKNYIIRKESKKFNSNDLDD